ncbi:MAG TPA: ATP-binding protein [Pyrinomonadaceae bacterium]|jgi:two-component system chemotaxis sensor kinase CheA
MDERLLKEFLAEAGELVEGLYGDIAELRERLGDGPARRELVARVFRRVHTVKGTAAAAGLDAAGRIAHEFESLLDAVRSGATPLDEETVAVFEEAAGAVAESLEAAARGSSWPEPEALVARLRRLSDVPEGAEGAGASGVAWPLPEPAELPGMPEEVTRSLSAHERGRLREALGEGARAYVVLAEFDIADFDERYRRLSESLKESGEIVATQPFVNAVGPDRIGFRIVYASTEGRERLEAQASAFGATLKAAGDEGDGRRGPISKDASNDSATPGEDEDRARDEAARGANVAAASESEGQRPPPPGAQGVRMTLEELDDLISAAHALFADTVGALDLALGAGGGGGRDELEVRAREVRRRFFELEERLIGLRMVTLRGALLRAARAGRAAARSAGKRVEFEVTGGDARLERSLAEVVADPLLHLVRNAVDHGVEAEGERLAAGKTAAGRVRIEADSEGGLVLVRVSDDGRGVDTDAVEQAAAAAGLVAPGAHVTEAQALRLIFRPGFSTAGRASLVSGRGVGLDVVERAVEEAGGEVRVRSERGRGTTFELRLPTTLALLPAHVFDACGRRYCVGASQVVGAGHAEASEVVVDGGVRRLRWRGRELPLVGMCELLGRRDVWETPPAGGRFAFFVAAGRHAPQGGDYDSGARAAIAVDGLEGESEVLVRGLGRHAKSWRGVAGATELRDGAVALVLDLPRLLEDTG